MAPRKTWLWIVAGVFGFGVLVLVAVAAAGVYFVAQRVDAEPASSAEAIRAFEGVLSTFGDARPLYEAPEMPLTLPRRNAADKGARTTRDLTEHPWAGVPVEVTLHAADAAGQEGTSETKTIVLPERPFNNPLAIHVGAVRATGIAQNIAVVLEGDAGVQPRDS